MTIKEMRNILGYRQEELAIVIGVTKATISRYENKRMDIEAVQQPTRKRLELLESLLINDKNEILKLSDNGGPVSLAALLVMGDPFTFVKNMTLLTLITTNSMQALVQLVVTKREEVMALWKSKLTA